MAEIVVVDPLLTRTGALRRVGNEDEVIVSR